MISVVAVLAGCGWFERDASPTPEPPPPQVPLAARDVPIPEGPNVVLIIGCTVRKDQLTPYGGPPELTPFLGGMAKRGALFETAIDAAPWTRPGHTAVLTGNHAAHIGMIEPSQQINSRKLAEEVTTVAEHLYGAGYATVGMTANPNLNALFGFSQGFEQYYEASGLWRDVGTIKVPGRTMAETAAQMLDRRPEPARPFYLQMTLVDAHAPYPRNPHQAKALQPDGAPKSVGSYRVGLQRFDAAIQHLQTLLGERGYTEENTLFMVVNDHGEGLHWPTKAHSVEHGYALYETSVGMPWIVSGPGIAKDHRIGGLASQVDVMPTLNGLLGIDGYTGPGQDWSAQLRGVSDKTTRTRAWVDTWFWESHRAAIYTEALACFDQFKKPRRERYSHPSPYCYNRVSDPHGLEPLPPVASLLEELHAWNRATKDTYEAWPHTADTVVDDDTTRQLEALGYVEPE